jgi:predicted permease
MDAAAYQALFDILAPISLIILIGFLLGKKSDKIDTVGMSRLAMLVGTPALVFSTLTTTTITSNVLLEVSLGALCVCLVAILLAIIFLKYLKYSLSTYLPSLTMPNSANLGLPIVLLTFGDDGLAFGIAFYFVIALFQYSIMPIVVVGKFSIASILQEPLIWAVAAALFIIFSNMEVPTVIADTTYIMGGMVIPVMLLLLGVSIAKLGFTDLKKTTGLAALRLTIGLLAGLIAINILGISGIASGTIFLMASMPSALVTYVFAARYDREPETVAGLVVTSTLITFVSLPLILLAAIFIAESST